MKSDFTLTISYRNSAFNKLTLYFWEAEKV